MTYEQLIETLRQHQTARIKAFCLPDSCAPHNIPNAFVALLPELITVLETHADHLCSETDHIVALFGLQPGSIALTSNYPLMFNRIINKDYPRSHLCCSLSYFSLAAEDQIEVEMGGPSSNATTHTLMVDFTTGKVMDSRYYLSQLFNEPLEPEGKIYGSLNQSKLQLAWTAVTQETDCLSVDFLSEGDWIYDELCSS